MQIRFAASGLFRQSESGIFRGSLQELNRDIIIDVLDTLLIYPDGRIEIGWNYEDDMRKLLLDSKTNGD